MSVSIVPGSRLRHWCSSRYLRISPLHREFRFPLTYSRFTVSIDIRKLSPRLLLPTYNSACVRFTPSNSGQRLPPTYYRGCWHVVCRGFLVWYRLLLFPYNRALHPEGFLHPRGVAGSGFPPLPNIPHCCLP